MPDWLQRLRQKADALKTDTYALYLAYRDPRTPWYAKVWGAVVVAYLLSPIDLIPDFIPVLGYVDDLILVPLGIAVAVRMIPSQVMADCRARAQQLDEGEGPRSRAGILAVAAIWLVVLGLVAWAIYARVAR
jgi:uncharacterized membrane protein YkvA (DUF1232 family)